MIGGSGERRTLRTVARCADRWNGPGSVARLSHSTDVLRAHGATEGRDPDTIELTVMNESHVTEDATEAHPRGAHRAHAEHHRGRLVGQRVDRQCGNVREQLEAFDAAGFDEAIIGLRPPCGARSIEMLEAVLT